MPMIDRINLSLPADVGSALRKAAGKRGISLTKAVEEAILLWLQQQTPKG